MIGAQLGLPSLSSFVLKLNGASDPADLNAKFAETDKIQYDTPNEVILQDLEDRQDNVMKDLFSTSSAYTVEKERKRLLAIDEGEWGPIVKKVIRDDFDGLVALGQASLDDDDIYDEWQEWINRPIDGIWFTPLCVALLVDKQDIAQLLLNFGATARFVEGSNTLIQYLALLDAHKAVLFLKQLDFEGFVGCRVKYRRMDLATIADEDIPVIAQILRESLVNPDVPDFSMLLSNNYLSILLHPDKLRLYHQQFNLDDPKVLHYLYRQAATILQRLCMSGGEYKQKDVEPAVLVLINQFIRPYVTDDRPAHSEMHFLGNANIVWPAKLLLKCVPEFTFRTIDAKNGYPLNSACRSENLQLIKLLLDMGSKVDGNCLIESMPMPAVLSLLIKSGAVFDLDTISHLIREGHLDKFLKFISQSSPCIINAFKPPVVQNPIPADNTNYPVYFTALLDTLALILSNIYLSEEKDKSPFVSSEARVQAVKVILRLTAAALTATCDYWKTVTATEHKHLFYSRTIASSYFALLAFYFRMLNDLRKFDTMLTEATAVLNDSIRKAFANETYVQTVCLYANDQVGNLKAARKYAALLEFGPATSDPWMYDRALPVWKKYSEEAETAKAKPTSKKAAAASTSSSTGSGGASKKQPAAPQPAGKKSAPAPQQSSSAKSPTSPSKDKQNSTPKTSTATPSASSSTQQPSAKKGAEPKKEVQTSSSSQSSTKQTKAVANEEPASSAKNTKTDVVSKVSETSTAAKAPSSSSTSSPAVLPVPAPQSTSPQPAQAPVPAPAPASSASDQGHRTNISLPECAICMDRTPDHAINCGHTFCGVCAAELKECAVCRQPVKAVIRLFFL